MNLFTKWKQTHRHRKQKERCGEINQEFQMNRYKLLYIKQINNKVLLYSTGSYIQYLITSCNGKEYGKRIYIYSGPPEYILMCCTSEINRPL